MKNVEQPRLSIEHQAAAMNGTVILSGALALCWFFSVSAVAQTPAGLLTLSEESFVLPAERDWEKLGVSNRAIRILDRFHRGGGYEGFHIAYKGSKLHITGILARPYIPPELMEKYQEKDTAEEDEELIGFPLVILNHGSRGGISAPYRAIALELASRGYVVLASTYRGRAGLEGRSQGVAELAKGEVLDVLQLTELGRRLEYVDSLRMGIIGEGHGATITLLAIERSNVFQVAVAISPPIFSGLAEFGFAGRKILEDRSRELFGRELGQNDLLRELYARGTFRFLPQITTPLLLIATSSDPSYRDQLRFVDQLSVHGIEHRLLAYPGLFPEFMTAVDNGNRPPEWRQTQYAAWTEVFTVLDEALQLPAEEEEESVR